MSWSICEMVNTVHIPNECAHDLFEEAQYYDGELWGNYEDVTDKSGLLRFGLEHMEHMDYLGTHNKVIRILKRYEVEGDICFGSLEGDNVGEFWGYRFDGHGGMKELKGKLVWEEGIETLKDKIIVITGTLESMTRDEAEVLVREAGGKASDAVSQKTDYLIVGSRPGSKLKKAKALGVKIIDEKKFKKLLG